MFFTRLGSIVAIAALLFGVFWIATGLAIANEMFGPYEQALARYFPNEKSAGAVIDRGCYATVFATVLGILTEIRYALRSKAVSL